MSARLFLPRTWGAPGTLEGMSTPPLPPASDSDLDVLRSQLGRVPRGVVGIAARACAGTPPSWRRLRDSTMEAVPHVLLPHAPAATAAMSVLEAGHVMKEFTDELANDEELRAAYTLAHEAYLRDRAVYGEPEEIAGISAGGMPTRVKCLHALAGHALAADPV